jgi:hypothetical protein
MVFGYMSLSGSRANDHEKFPLWCACAETLRERHRQCRPLCQGQECGINLPKIAEQALAQRLAEQVRQTSIEIWRRSTRSLRRKTHSRRWPARTTQRPIAIHQFDVLDNPIPGARRAMPFVAILQSDLAETSRDRAVAPLAPRAAIPTVAGPLIPIVEVANQDYALLVPRSPPCRGPICGRPSPAWRLTASAFSPPRLSFHRVLISNTGASGNCGEGERFGADQAAIGYWLPTRQAAASDLCGAGRLVPGAGERQP